MTKHTSRQRILAYLNLHNGASAAEISLSLRVTAANIRHHLAILVSDGRVKELGFRPDAGRGRPVKIYGLGELAQGDNLAGLADVLLNHFLESTVGEERDRLLERLALKLVAVSDEPGGHVTRRLTQTVNRLGESGYAARWEAHLAAPRIIFEHCPYEAIIARHPELCQVDGKILERLLRGQVEQTAKLEKNTRGTLFCQFLVKNMLP